MAFREFKLNSYSYSDVNYMDAINSKHIVRLKEFGHYVDAKCKEVMQSDLGS